VSENSISNHPKSRVPFVRLLGKGDEQQEFVAAWVRAEREKELV